MKAKWKIIEIFAMQNSFTVFYKDIITNSDCLNNFQKVLKKQILVGI